VADLLLALDIEESDGVCHDCSKGPHLHLAERSAIEASLVQDHLSARLDRIDRALLALLEGPPDG